MNPDPVTITPEKTLSAAIQLMRAERVDSLLVIDEKNVLQGYVDVEMIDRKRKQAALVAEVLERDLYTVRSGTLLRDAVHKILKEA